VNTTAAKTLRTAVALLMLLAVGMSFTHIAELAAMGGAGWERWVAPVLIDFVAILGKVGTGSQFNAHTRRVGRRSLWVAGTLSLTANVGVGYAHGSVSGMVIGAGVVAVALWGESYLHGMGVKASAVRKTTPATPKVNKDGKTAEQVKRSAAARKAAATRAARKAEAATQALAVPADVVPATRYI
jgi:hypothetical protein